LSNHQIIQIAKCRIANLGHIQTILPWMMVCTFNLN